MAKEKPGGCVLTEGCIKYDGHHLEKHVGSRACSTYEEAYPDDGGEGKPGPKVTAEAARITAPVKERKKPVRDPLPMDPTLWRLKHVTRCVDAIERIWKRIPPGKRALAREDVAAIVGQRDVEEVKS
jgi:hypothetical protein